MRIIEINEEKEKKQEEEKQILNFSVGEFEKDSEFNSDEEINKKVISYIEKLVRNSFEYRNYIQYLKEELDLTRCSLLEGLNIHDLKFSLEFHHFPFNLYEISEIILKSFLKKAEANETSFSLFDVAETIVKEHYLNNIGLVPLSKTIHEMAHSNSIFIPIKKVYGGYRNFMNKYKDFIDDEKKQKILNIEMYNDDHDAIEFNNQKLKKKINNFEISYKESGE